MDPAFRRQLILQEGIDHPMARGLHLRLESVRRDIYSEVGFPRRAALHGFVMGVQV